MNPLYNILNYNYIQQQAQQQYHQNQVQQVLEASHKLQDFLDSVDKVDTVVLAVAHNEYKELTEEYLKEIQNDEPVIIDIKSIKDAEKLKNTKYWRL